MAVRPTITLRPIIDDDLEFLFRLYASTRADELAVTGWDAVLIEHFLRMQFNLQHTQYQRNYPGASFDLVCVDAVSAGRLYVQRRETEMRLIDIALLPEYRGKGLGGRLLGDLTREADEKEMVMSLHVEVNNPVLAFYMRLGFREEELRGVYRYMERQPFCTASPHTTVTKGSGFAGVVA